MLHELGIMYTKFLSSRSHFSILVTKEEIISITKIVSLRSPMEPTDEVQDNMLTVS